MVHHIRSACRGENEIIIIIIKTLAWGEMVSVHLVLYSVCEVFVNAKKKKKASLNP